MSKTNTWDNMSKVAAYRELMRYLHNNDVERKRCLDYACGREIFLKAAAAAGVTVPPDTRIVFLPEGDYLRGNLPPTARKRGAGLTYHDGSSLIITLPPDGNPADDTWLMYTCSYVLWPPHRARRGKPKKQAQTRKRVA